MENISTKKTKTVNNKPNCLKRTKDVQRVNMTKVTLKDGSKFKTSVREARAMKKNNELA